MNELLQRLYATSDEKLWRHLKILYRKFYSLRLFSPVFGFGAEGVTIAAVGTRVQKRLSMKCLKMKSFCIFNLTEQPVEQWLSVRKIVGSIAMGPIQSQELKLFTL